MVLETTEAFQSGAELHLGELEGADQDPFSCAPEPIEVATSSFNRHVRDSSGFENIHEQAIGRCEEAYLSHRTSEDDQNEKVNFERPFYSHEVDTGRQCLDDVQSFWAAQIGRDVSSLEGLTLRSDGFVREDRWPVGHLVEGVSRKLGPYVPGFGWHEVGANGNIINRDGNVIGRVELLPYAAQKTIAEELSWNGKFTADGSYLLYADILDLSILKGLPVQGNGEVLNSEGVCVGELIDGDAGALKGCKVGDHGEVVSSDSKVLGRVRIFERTSPKIATFELERQLKLDKARFAHISDVEEYLGTLGDGVIGASDVSEQYPSTIEMRHEAHGLPRKNFEQLPYMTRFLKLVDSTDFDRSLRTFARPQATTAKLICFPVSKQGTRDLSMDDDWKSLLLCSKSWPEWRKDTRPLKLRRTCIVENINPDWIRVIGTECDIDPYFFALHWTMLGDWSQTIGPEFSYGPLAGLVRGRVKYCDDVVERRKRLSEGRHFDRDPGEHENSRTNFLSSDEIQACNVSLSYYMKKDLILIFVDGPFDCVYLEDYRPKLRAFALFEGCSRGSYVKIPQPFSVSKFSLLKILEDAFQDNEFHRNTIDRLLDPNPICISDFTHKLLYTLAVWVWQANMKHLDYHVKRISFGELRKPDAKINGDLHDLREDLHYLKSSLSQLLDSLALSIKHGGGPAWSPTTLHITAQEETDKINKMLESAKALDSLLMETFQVLMSSLSVQDSKTSLQQSKRGTLVTGLAFVYVPLSFVTGIFGMNLNSVNGSPLPFWACFIALAVVLVFTVAMVGGYKFWEIRKKKATELE